MYHAASHVQSRCMSQSIRRQPMWLGNVLLCAMVLYVASRNRGGGAPSDPRRGGWGSQHTNVPMWVSNQSHLPDAPSRLSGLLLRLVLALPNPSSCGTAGVLISSAGAWVQLVEVSGDRATHRVLPVSVVGSQSAVSGGCHRKTGRRLVSVREPCGPP